MSIGKSMELDTHGQEAAQPAPTPIREDRTPRGRCCASSSNTGSNRRKMETDRKAKAAEAAARRATDGQGLEDAERLPASGFRLMRFGPMSASISGSSLGSSAYCFTGPIGITAPARTKTGVVVKSTGRSISRPPDTFSSVQTIHFGFTSRQLPNSTLSEQIEFFFVYFCL